MGYLLIILQQIFHQGETMIVKKYGQKHHVGGVLFNAFVCLFSMVFFIITDKNGFYFPGELWIYGLVSCVMTAGGFYYMYAALKAGSFALTKLLSSFSGIITICYGIFVLNEPVNYLTYISFALVFASVFLMNYTKDHAAQQKKKKQVSVKWLIYVVIVLVTNGLIGVLKRMQQLRFDNACSNEFMIISLGGAFIALFVFGLILEREHLGDIVRHGTLYGMGAGLLNGTSNMANIAVLLYVPISVATPLNTGLSIVTSFAISALIYKEKFTKLQLAGAFAGVAALVLLKISQSI